MPLAARASGAAPVRMSPCSSLRVTLLFSPCRAQRTAPGFGRREGYVVPPKHSHHQHTTGHQDILVRLAASFVGSDGPRGGRVTHKTHRPLQCIVHHESTARRGAHTFSSIAKSCRMHRGDGDVQKQIMGCSPHPSERTGAVGSPPVGLGAGAPTAAARRAASHQQAGETCPAAGSDVPGCHRPGSAAVRQARSVYRRAYPSEQAVPALQRPQTTVERPIPQHARARRLAPGAQTPASARARQLPRYRPLVGGCALPAARDTAGARP